MGACVIVGNALMRTLPDGYAVTTTSSVIRIHRDLASLLDAARNASGTQERQLDELTGLMRAILHRQDKMIHLLSKIKGL